MIRSGSPSVDAQDVSEPAGPPQAVDDPRVVQCAETYLAAWQEGKQPDRQALLCRFPELVGELAQCLDAIDFVERAQARASLLEGSLGDLPPHATGPPVTIGDFRIVREIGRGGMGIVYEAEQLSLRRRVALKVLPFAAVLDPRQLKRFENEALAAASLKHPNIVQVYAVGCERGIHYYAMEYVAGQTLAEVIRQLRPPAKLEPTEPRSADAEVTQLARDLASGRLAPLPEQPGGDDAVTVDAGSVGAETARPSLDATRPSTARLYAEGSVRSRAFFRSLAHLGVQAAEALEHAHQMGVVHRDIKPSNLMADAGGHLLVTDFGLAQTRSGPNLTMTGDLLGTLRYMSPEQARGNRQVLDQRTDIYSLGVTLYELLTLQPAFGSADRGTLIQEIIESMPRLPRALMSAIPRDLETIVLKAMAADPEGRYATAGELASDLRRFLEDKPIRARRPSLATRIAKWTRRHVWLVVACTVMLFVLSVVMAVATVLVLGQQQQTEAARRQAVLAMEEANSQRARATEERRQSQLLSANLALDRGLTLCTGGEIGQGMLWFARALEVAPGDAEDLRRVTRANLADWARRAIRLDGMLENPGDDTVRKIAFSPGADWVLTLGRDGSVAQWQLGPSGPLTAIPRGIVKTVPPHFSGDARLLVTGNQEGKLPLVDRTQPANAIRLPWSDAAPAGDVALALDGRTAVVAKVSGPVELWNTTSGTKIARTTARGSFLDFAPDGKTVCTGSIEGVSMWDAATGQRRGRTVWEHAYCGKFSSDGRQFLAGDEFTARLYDPATWEVLGRPLPHGKAVRCVAFSPDDALLLTGSDDRTVRLWDAATHEPVGQPLVHGGGVLAVRFRPDGRSFLTAAPDCAARLWELPLGPAGKFRHVHPAPIRLSAFSSDGKTLLVACEDNSIHLWDATTGNLLVGPIAHPSNLHDAAFGPDAKTFVTAAGDCVRLWDTACGTCLRQSDRLPSPPRLVRFMPDGANIVAIDLGNIQLLDPATLALVKSVKPIAVPGAASTALAFSANVPLLLSGWSDGSVRLHDLRTGKLRLDPLRNSAPVECVGFSRDGTQLLASCPDGSVWLWDAGTGERLGPLLRNQPAANGTAFSPDGRIALAVYGDASARLLDLATSRPVGCPLEHHTTMNLIVFSPDGRRVVTRDADRRAVWVQQVPVPPGGSDEQLVLWTQLATGLELDATGCVQVLGPQAWHARRQHLASVGGPPKW